VWRVACGVWRVACGVWRVACGVWRVACGVWRVACERVVYVFGWFYLQLLSDRKLFTSRGRKDLNCAIPSFEAPEFRILKREVSS
jgi:hypothetical protein